MPYFLITCSGVYSAVVFLFQAILPEGVLEDALRASDVPPSVRAAFTVELSNGSARRIYNYDPRRDRAQRWQQLEAHGQDAGLDRVAQSWAQEEAPDGRLFPDDLADSLSGTVHITDRGDAWRIDYRHVPSVNDTDFDIWAIQNLRAEAWLDPLSRRFLRVDYTLPHPVAGPQGGRLVSFKQSYLLEYDPVWQLSYISTYKLAIEAQAAFRRFHQDYEAVILEATFFFATAEAETSYMAANPNAKARPFETRAGTSHR